MNHPEMCYVFIATENAVGIVKWGENGYYKTDYPHNFTNEVVDEMNEKLGLTKKESDSMMYCSMANLPETNEAWEKHYNMCMEIKEKHNKEREGK